MAADLVPAEQQRSLAVPTDVPEWLTQTGQPTYSTLDLSKPENVAVLSRVSIACDKQLSDMIGAEIEVSAFYTAPYEKTDPATAEVIQLLYIALIGSDGMTYGCSSIGVKRSLLLLCQMFGFNSWEPPIKVKVRQIKAALGHMMALEFVSRPNQTTPKTKGK